MFAGNSDVTLLNSLSLFAIKEIKKSGAWKRRFLDFRPKNRSELRELLRQC
ncbi:hypothetical protein FHW00_003186 [Ochrobactrum sp. P6BSIII]|nr:hypothetical protein [Ochrobactrum sp. P6BSIII]